MESAVSGVVNRGDAVWRERGFLLLWVGQFLSILADWALRTMLLIWVYKLTRSGVMVSLVGLAEALPLLLLAPVAGVFVDRWSRSRTMGGAVLARLVLVLPLLLVVSRADLPLLLLVTVLTNAASQFFMPAASAAVPSVVGVARAGQANSLLSLINGSVAVVGPGAAALLFALIGPHGTVAILALIYLSAVPVLLCVPAPRVPTDGAATSVWAEMRDGLRYMRRSRLLIALAAVAFVAFLGIGAISVLDVVFVVRALHLHTEAVGILLTCSGAGELAGGVVLSVLSRRIARHHHLLLGVAVIGGGLGFVGYALAPSLQVAIVVQFLIGLSFPPIIVPFMTLVQLVTEDAFMGRVTSLINMGMSVAMIASVTFGGALTDLFGVRQVIAGAALALMLAGVLSLIAIRSSPEPRLNAAPRTEVDQGALVV